MATAQQQLTTLLQPQTDAQVDALLLASLQANNFTVTDWNTGGVERTALAAIRTGLVDLSSDYIPTIAAGGFLDLADDDWVTLKANQDFDLTRFDPTFTLGLITLTSGAGVGPYTLAAGDVYVLFPSGNRYVNTTGGILNASSTLTLTFQSQYQNNSQASPPLNYNDASGLAIVIITPALPGVVATNPPSVYSTVTQLGTGTGTLTLAGTPTGSHTVAVRIDTSGQSGICSWSTSIDGAAYVSQGAVASIVNLGGLGVNITLANGAGTPSFVAGELYTFSFPGTWVTQQGTDKEAKAALVARAHGRWPNLSVEPTVSGYEAIARQASPQVTQVRVQTDGTVNNRVLIYIAGQGGVLPGNVVSLVQAYVKSRVGLTDQPLVGSPAPITTTLSSATVKVSLNQLAAAKAAAQLAVQTYINFAGINGRVQLANIIDLVMNISGVQNITGLSIVGANDGVDLQLPTTLGSMQIPSFTQDITSTWTWLGV